MCLCVCVGGGGCGGKCTELCTRASTGQRMRKTERTKSSEEKKTDSESRGTQSWRKSSVCVCVHVHVCVLHTDTEGETRITFQLI